MSESQFKFFTEYLATRYGLRIVKEKKVLLESRLLSRINALKMESIDQYIEHTFKGKGSNDEYQYFVDNITTHKTFFFREHYQFDFISKNLPAYLQQRVGTGPLMVWSAGCSTGEEVYTIGMLLDETRQQLTNMDYRVIGTDISIPSLRKAATGIFTTELENLPDAYKEKYFTSVQTPKGNGLQFNNPEIKSKIRLGTLNLNNKVYNLPGLMDFAFCRNVTIYFDTQTRYDVLRKIVDKLRPGGYLFLGHSETALGISLPLKSIQPTIYQKLF
jgi:chemotaxis protein methyltransferase CheR